MKKRKHEDNGKTSTPIDGMYLERPSDISPSSTSDVFNQLKDIIQVKVNTDERLQNLEEKVGKLQEKEKRKKVKMKELIDEIKEHPKRELINKIKEDLKRELINEIKEDLKRGLINEIKEDLKTELIDKFKEDLKLEFQEEMQKLEEKVENKSKEHFSVFKEDIKKQLKEEPDLVAPSLRTPFQLKFNCEINSIIYKGKSVRTSDSDHIDVVMYDDGKLIAHDHHLASATVELVVVDAEFSGNSQEYWSEDSFLEKIMKSRQPNNPKVEVKNNRFRLNGGRHRHTGFVIMENSNRKDFKLGVMIVGTKVRVLEGVSNSFRVQEAKTEKGQGPQYIHPKPGPTNSHNMLNPSGTGNGSVGPLPLDLSRYPAQQDITQIGSYVQGPPPTFQRKEHNFGIVPNQSQKTHAHTSGNGLGGQPLVDHLQQLDTNQQGATQHKDHGQGQQHMHPKTGPTNSHNTLNPSSTSYHGNVSVGPLPLDLLPYPTQQEYTQTGTYVQGPQPTFVMTEHNFGIAPNQSHKTHAHTTGNGPRGQPPVNHLLQQNSPQQCATQQEHHVQGPTPTFLQTEHNFGIVSNQSQNTHAHIAGNGLGGQPLVNHLQQLNTTQQGATQQKDHVQGPQPTFVVTEHNFGIPPNQSQKAHAHTTANGPRGQPLVQHLQRQNTPQQGATQQVELGQDQQPMQIKTGSTNSHHMMNPSGTTYHDTTGNVSVGPLPLDLLPYPTQQEYTQTGTYVQAPLPTYLTTERNLGILKKHSQETHAHTTGNGPRGQPPLVNHLVQQNSPQQCATQQEAHGQGQQHMHPIKGPTNSNSTFNPSGTTYHHTSGPGLQPTFLQTMHNIGIMSNQSQKTHAHTTGDGPGVQPLLDHLQQPNTPQLCATQHENHGPGQQYIHPKTGTTNSHTTLNPSGTTDHPTAGNGSVGPLPLDLLQSPTQHAITQMGIYVQGLQPTFLPAGHNFGIALNQLQEINAQTTGNGPGGQPLVDCLQQQNSTQQGATQQEYHGHGRGSHPPVDHLQQRNNGQQGASQYQDHGSDVVLNLDLNNRDDGSSTHVMFTGLAPGSGPSADHSATPDDEHSRFLQDVLS